jgi:hypothetical protein
VLIASYVSEERIKPALYCNHVSASTTSLPSLPQQLSAYCHTMAKLQTANFSAVLIAPTASTDITTPNQLYGQKVLTAPLYENATRIKFGVLPEVCVWRSC